MDSEENNARLQALENLQRYMNLVTPKPQGLAPQEREELEKLAKDWPQITSALFGEETNHAVAFIDICGATASLGDMYRSDHPADRYPTIATLREFQSTLGYCAINYPDLEVYAFSDSGFIIGPHAERVFLAMHVAIGLLHAPLGQMQPIPVRGAFSYGKTVVGDVGDALKVKNFIAGPLASEALVKVAMMEKSKERRGIRFFATDSFKKQMPVGLQDLISSETLGTVSVAGSSEEPYSEVYWTVPVLSTHPRSADLLSFYKTWGKDWIASENSYRREIGASILEMAELFEHIQK